MSFRLLSKLGSVLKNVWSPNFIIHMGPGRSPTPIFTSSISTTSVCYNYISFDPIIDVLYEDLLKKARLKSQPKKESKMLSRASPDLIGLPIVPIDINLWMDQEEFDHLMGNSSLMRRKLLTIGEMSIQQQRDIVRTLDEVIDEKTEPEYKQNNTKVESEEEVKPDKTVKKEIEEESDDNVDAEQMIAEALGQRSKTSKDN